MVAAIPQSWIHLNTKVTSLERDETGWQISFSSDLELPERERFDAVLMAVPAHIAGTLLEPVDARAAELTKMEASSAVVVGFGFDDAAEVPVPPGFGFLVPPGSKTNTLLMACTFMDQKFPDRVPAGGRLLRAFFGGKAAERLMHCRNDETAAVARMELAHILGPLPEPRVTVIRRLPSSLPQYSVGHLERMAELQSRVSELGDLWLLGNGYRGVGLPDLIRDARAAAQAQSTHTVQ
jgi:oxygen-dependent protoporphyrinogen oxidase